MFDYCFFIFLSSHFGLVGIEGGRRGVVCVQVFEHRLFVHFIFSFLANR